MTPGAPEMRSIVFAALGGTCELYAVGPSEPLEATAQWIGALHRRLTRFEPDSELSRFNARAGRWIEVSPELQALLELGLRAFDDSEGLVNIAVLPALVAAGYSHSFEEVATGVPIRSSRRGHVLCHPPDDRSHNALRAGPLPALDDVLTVRCAEARLAPGAAVDLGGLAKGWIADRAAERLGPNSLASCGGDLFARGGGETGDGWPVGFGDRTVLLRDLGAATSGTTKRRWGNSLHHLIDPRTGAPAVSDLEEVSVLASTAADAEVLAKTALLLGSTLAPAYLDARSPGWALS